MKHNTPAQEVKSLETLFFTFFKIGLFTFGGGYAMIALLEEEFIQRRNRVALGEQLVRHIRQQIQKNCASHVLRHRQQTFHTEHQKAR